MPRKRKRRNIMKRGSQVRQSIAVSAVLLAALFILPLAVIVPFRSELFGRETPVDETEGEPLSAATWMPGRRGRS